jgi:hypothetical protein
MQLTEALSLIRSSRKPVLFLGAGFANQAPNLDGESTPSSRQLVARMLERIPVEGDADTPLSFAVDQLREKRTPSEAHTFLVRQLTTNEPTLEQLKILALPWQRIYTTNIDNIGLSHSNRRCLDASSDTAPSDRGDFIYLHGCLANCQPNNYYQKVKMGEQLYLAGSHSSSPYHSLLKQDLHESDCVIVIGYSMGDPDLSRLFYGSPSLINKCFVFSGDTKPLDHHRINAIGSDTKQTSTDFLAAFEAQPTNSVPQFSSQITVEHGNYDSKPVLQASRQNLLIYGRFDRNVARTSWSNTAEPTYAIQRTIGDILAGLAAPSTAIVHSHLGNGKTLIFEYARYIAGQNRIAFAIDPTVEIDQLRALLTEIPTGAHVFFEGDIFHVSKIQDIIAERNLIFCATSRTTTMRVAARAIYSNSRSSIRTFDANRLSHDELVDFHELIDTMGFWPAGLNGESPERRIAALEKQYESSTCSIVLAIFENEQIRAEIAAIWDRSAPALGPYTDHLVIASYMDLIDLNAPPYLIKSFSPIDYPTGVALSNELISISHHGILSFSSAVIGEFIFQNIFDKETIIGSVVRFANYISGHASQRKYQWIVRRLLRFWNLSRLLKSTTLPEQVFDRASYIPSIASDPLFWVQYSISKMENGDYLPARRFVETAYAKAKERGPGFDTYQIDTHAARLVVRSIIDNGLYEGFAADLNRSMIALKNVAERRPDDVYHVSAVVTRLLSAGIPFAYEMTEREYSTFRNALIAIGDKINDLAGGSDFSFVPERQASELIDALR